MTPPPPKPKLHTAEETHYTPKGGPCSVRCDCGLLIEARYPKELEDMFREHRKAQRSAQ
jgi:hypothetical protein